MKHLEFSIDGKNLQRAYSVYIIEVKNKKTGRSYYYIGQTSNVALSVRSPFARLACHLHPHNKSGENIIYEGIKDSEIFDSRKKIEHFIVNSTIRIIYFPLSKYYYSKRDSEPETIINETKLMEKKLIHHFSQKFGEALLNKLHYKKNIYLNNTQQQKFIAILEELDRKGIDVYFDKSDPYLTL